MHIQIIRQPWFRAPREPMPIWALNVSYASLNRPRLVMSINRVDACGYKRADDWPRVVDCIQRAVSDDNGRTWRETGPIVRSGPYESGRIQNAWMHFMDPENGALLSLFSWRTGSDKPYSMQYELSNDEGHSWTKPASLFSNDSEFSKLSLVADQAPFAKLDDGTIVCGVNCAGNDRMSGGVAFLRGRWNAEQNGMNWEVGQTISMLSGAMMKDWSLTTPEDWPLTEPDLLPLGGTRLLTTLRFCGDEKKGVCSSRQCALSEDGGKTWSRPWTLTYDDGSPVHVPAALAAFERHPASGRVFWFANILEHPVHGCDPRYPLAMAEFDTDRLCLKKKTVTAVLDLPPGASNDTRCSNFGHYVDRENGDIILAPGEEYYLPPNYQTDDFYAYRIRIVDV